jgi:hypothetical protein
MNDTTKAFVEVVADKLPNIWKTSYPRRIVPPQGFANPKIYAATLAGSTAMWEHSEMNMLPHTTCCLNALLMSTMTVPTYFIRNEFAQAIANTKLPADFKLSELKWPLDAMLFVLPDTFVQSYFEAYTPFLGVCRCPAGTYPSVQHVNFAVKNRWEISTFTPVMNQTDRMLIHFPCYSADELPQDYTGNWPLSLDLSSIRSADFVDATIYERAIHNIPVELKTASMTPEQDKALQDKMTVFAVKLLLAFTARPHLIKNGSLVRPAKIKQGKTIKDELWSPNLVGWDYVIQRNGSSQGGTHASPRMTWRVGHFTHQFIGKRNDPSFVSASDLPRKEKEGTIDWNKVEPAIQEAFWRNHKLHWLEPVLCGGDESKTL